MNTIKANPTIIEIIRGENNNCIIYFYFDKFFELPGLNELFSERSTISVSMPYKDALIYVKTYFPNVICDIY